LPSRPRSPRRNRNEGTSATRPDANLRRLRITRRAGVDDPAAASRWCVHRTGGRSADRTQRIRPRSRRLRLRAGPQQRPRQVASPGRFETDAARTCRVAGGAQPNDAATCTGRAQRYENRSLTNNERRHGIDERMAETRIGTGKATARAAAPAAKGAAAAKTVAAPSVVIRRVRKRVEDGPPPAAPAASSLSIGDRRVSTMVDVDPETLALFDPSPFGYAAVTGPLGTISSAAFTDGADLAADLPEPEAPLPPPVEAVTATPPPEAIESESAAIEARKAAAKPATARPAQEVVEPAPASEDEEEFSDKVSADEAQRITDAYSDVLLKREEVVPAPAVADGTPEVAAKRTGPRVLGRIDLTRKPVPARPPLHPQRREQPTSPQRKAKPPTPTVAARKSARSSARKTSSTHSSARTRFARARRRLRRARSFERPSLRFPRRASAWCAST